MAEVKGAPLKVDEKGRMEELEEKEVVAKVSTDSKYVEIKPGEAVAGLDNPPPYPIDKDGNKVKEEEKDER